MVLSFLKLVNFRNYLLAEIRFKDGILVLFGKNGQGKTNILESIYYLALTKSFRTSNDLNLILNGQDFFRIQGELVTRQGRTLTTSMAYSKTEGKRLVFNNQKIQKFSDYIGNIPVVLLAPSDLEISQSGPQRRRQFLDVMLSQGSKLYLYHLIQYRRSLRQRNALLQSENPDKNLLQSWEDALVENGVVLVRKRQETVRLLEEQVRHFYQQLSGSEDKIKLIYRCSFPAEEEPDLKRAFRRALEANRDKDLLLGTTSVGPHRDDILFLINGKPLRAVGSQGEHKTFVIALKMAEFHFLRGVQEEPPLLLLDDIFGELDAERISNMIGSLSEIGQVFITTTSPDFFGKVKQWDQNVTFYEIQQGTVTVREDLWEKQDRLTN